MFITRIHLMFFLFLKKHKNKKNELFKYSFINVEQYFIL